MNGEECVTGSGRCCETCEECDEEDIASRWKWWDSGDTCPYRTDKQSGEASIATGPDPLRFEGTNGRKKLCLNSDMNQLAASLGDKFGREEILLDETNTTCRKTDWGRGLIIIKYHIVDGLIKSLVGRNIYYHITNITKNIFHCYQQPDARVSWQEDNYTWVIHYWRGGGRSADSSTCMSGQKLGKLIYQVVDNLVRR